MSGASEHSSSGLPDFFSWYRRRFAAGHAPWLIYGKGPSFASRSQFDVSGYEIFGLNHVVREQRVTVAHAIDVEVVEHCAASIPANCEVLVMPWVPHVRSKPSLFRKHITFAPGYLTLCQYCERLPVLAELRRQGRLLWYNLSSAPKKSTRPGSEVVRAETFSSVAAAALLSKAGVRHIRTLGIDGGASYSSQFTDLNDKTKLQTGQSSFDEQFREIARIIMETNTDFAPLGVEAPVRVYVGMEPEQDLACRVLEYSIRRRCSMSVLVQPLCKAIAEAHIEVPLPKAPEKRPRTPFSFQRFAIPALRGYRGRAIYLDSDMLVFGDIKTLWTWPMEDAPIAVAKEPEGTGRRPQFSVMVLDCEKLSWDVRAIVDDLDRGRWSYEQLMYDMAVCQNVARTIPSSWNDLERYNPGDTQLIHFTDMELQPWLSTRNPAAHLWCAALLQAIEAGTIRAAEVAEQVERGWIRPSLEWQVQRKQAEPSLIPRHVAIKDALFVPPHRKAEMVGALEQPGAGHLWVKAKALGRVAKGRMVEVATASGLRSVKRAIDRHL